MTLLLLCLALQQPPLTQEEIALLELPFAHGVFDPAAKKSQRVRGLVSVRTCYGRKELVDAPGWLIPAEGGRPARLVLNNLQEVPAPEQLKPSSFPEATMEESRYTSFSDIVLGKYMGAQTLIWASWLHRLGRDQEAAKLLLRLQSKGLVEKFQEGYGWELFNAAINAYMVGDDEDAIAALERLVTFQNPNKRQGLILLSELRRRKVAGTFGKAFTPLPANLASWPVEKKIDRLIEMLDQLNSGGLFPGEMDLDEQPAARALVACGEAAVPSLLRCAETDPRLTRSIGLWRQEYVGRNVLTVKVAALRILGAILRTSQWDPKKRIMALNFGEEEDESDQCKVWAAHIRKYWDEQRAIAFPERMVRVLRDPASSLEAQFEASENLARLDRVPSLRRFRGWLPADDPIVRALRSDLAAYKDPTIAESVIASMDRHKVSQDEKAPGGNWGEIIVKEYLPFLEELGDPRMAPVLLKRHAEEQNPRTRRRLALTLRRLGEAGPFDAIAKEVLGADRGFPESETVEILEMLGRGATQASEQALAAIARKGHAWHGFLRERVLSSAQMFIPDPDIGHPYCLTILRDALDEAQPTGSPVRLWSPAYTPPLPTDPSLYKEQTEERWCDRAGVQLSVLIPDSPRFHPLLKDAEVRLRQLRDYMDQHKGKFRRMTTSEMAARGLPWFRIYFVVGQ